MFKQLQKEHKIWAEKNFGKQDVEDYCLGMIEEVGELAHAVLKRKQGIRNNENHDTNIKDAIGDIVIYLVGFCNHYNIKLFRIEKYESENSVKTIFSELFYLINKRDLESSIVLLRTLKTFSFQEGFDFEQAVMDTWNKVVSKRDWKNNPDCVSAEEAKKTIHDSGFSFNEFEIPIGFKNNIIVDQGKELFNNQNICKDCKYYKTSPQCGGFKIIYGAKIDNVIECGNYKEKGFKEVSEDMGYPV